MAVKDKEPGDSISVFDPTLGAYHEVSVQDIKKQLVSLGLTEQEADAKIENLKKGA
jgi:hypothetical protein